VNYSRPTTADASGVSSRDEFATFLERVLTDYGTSGRGEWENTTLESFLDALGAFAGARLVDRDNQEEPTWQLFAEMIVAATVYE
jgi:hypothetical protein